jgi:hypothetical protein
MAPNTTPLPPERSLIDAVGAPLVAGARVRVLSVASCQSGLPVDDQARLKRYEGTLMTVSEIDRYGFVWLAAPGESSFFCLKPEEVQIA